MLIPNLSPRQWRWSLAAVFALVAIILWLLFRFISPAPPSTITITAGAKDGAYYQFALRYKAFLAENGIKLNVQTSSGSVENLQRLNDSQVEVGLVQSGLGFLTTDPGKDPSESSLQSLATLAYEPIWIFSRNDYAGGLSALAGKRVAVGAEGSGSRRVALDLLQVYGVEPKTATLTADAGAAAADALMAGSVDAVILIAAPESVAVDRLLRAPGIKLTSLTHTEGLARRSPYLQPVILKRGAFDPRQDIPAADVPLLATTANLVVVRRFTPRCNHYS